jgi:CPA2 family monovalent cation:H+ antiporter-2
VALAHERSRELFTLGRSRHRARHRLARLFVFGASFALGAFVAGLVLAASPLGHAAAERSLPLRDAFAVLFFVAVGMQFDPRILVVEPLAVLGLLAVILLAGSGAAALVALASGLARPAALILAASISQAGEFSFILASLGLRLDLIERSAHDVISPRRFCPSRSIRCCFARPIVSAPRPPRGPDTFLRTTRKRLEYCE